MSNEQTKAERLAETMEEDWPVSRSTHDKAAAELRRLAPMEQELERANNSFGSQTAVWPGLAERIEDLKWRYGEQHQELERLRSERDIQEAAISNLRSDLRECATVRDKEIERLRAECEALRKDAERYRLFRSANMDTRNRFEHFAWSALDEVLDAAIDAASNKKVAPIAEKEQPPRFGPYTEDDDISNLMGG